MLLIVHALLVLNLVWLAVWAIQFERKRSLMWICRASNLEEWMGLTKERKKERLFLAGGEENREPWPFWSMCCMQGNNWARRIVQVHILKTLKF